VLFPYLPAEIDEPNLGKDPIAEEVLEGVDEGLDEVNDVQTEDEDVKTKDEVGDTVITTRSGRVLKLPSYLQDNYETSNLTVDYETKLTAAEENYYQAMSEFGFSCVDHDGVEMAMVGAGIGGGFLNTNKPHTIKFHDAKASPDKDEWLKAVDDQYQNLQENGVFEVTATCDVPKEAKVLSLRQDFTLDEQGKLCEYVGCKIERDKKAR
jgi:hypothetical protein